MRAPRSRMMLGTLLALSVVIVLSVALAAQHRNAERRERALKLQSYLAETHRRADERVQRLLSNRGISILKGATEVELLQVADPARTALGFVPADYDAIVTPTGKVFGKEFAVRLARVLLDPRIYSYLGADDLPEPQFGLRVRRGNEMLDILISLESPSLHQDVWVRMRADGGEVLNTLLFPVCLYDPTFQKLGEEVRGN